MKRFILLIISIFFIVGAAWAASLNIDSDKQSFKDKENKILLEGNVKVKMDDIHVSSPRAEVELDQKTKSVKDVKFSENAYSYQVKDNKKHEIKSNIINMSLIDKTIIAQGNAQSSIMENGKPTIIVTADKQEYNNKTNVMKALGTVIVYYQDSETFSETAIVDLNGKNEIKRIQLIGNAIITQKSNTIKADKLNYDAPKQEAAATGNVYTHVHTDKGEELKVWSNYQMYDQRNNVLTASGSTKIVFKDYVATGPKASVFPDKNTNKLNEVIFTGRSKIVQQGRVIEADRIRMTMDPKDFSAEGNVKTFIPNVKGIN